jgi:hypothetical protein
MARSVLIALFALAACAGVAFAQPSDDPNRLVVTLTTDTPQYIGPCPTVIEFAGLIVGPPGTIVQYKFTQRYGIQPPPYMPSVMATIPPSGRLHVFDAVVIDAAHAGGHGEDLVVTPGAIKATAALYASCVSATN